MSNQYTVLFYDGNKSVPRESGIEIQHNAVYIFDTDGSSEKPLVYQLNKSHVSYLGDKLFLYVFNGGGAFIEMHSSHPLYQTIQEAMKQSPQGWFEKLVKKKWSLLLLFLVGLLVVIYFLMAEFVPYLAVSFISNKQEVVIGEKLYQSIVIKSEVDSLSTFKMQEFTNQLQLSNRYPIQVTVVKSKDINAFALPGGHIVVYAALLNMLNRPEELVALLGHEASHINKRHSLKGMLSGLSIGLMESIVFSGFGNVGDIILRNAGNLQQLSFSRKLEREADFEGMQLMVQNKIDPVGMKKLMELLQKTNKSILPIFSFISSHPLTDERIKNANTFILQHKSTNFAVDSSLQKKWDQLKQKK